MGLNKDFEDKKEMLNVETITADALEKLPHSFSNDQYSAQQKNEKKIGNLKFKI